MKYLLAVSVFLAAGLTALAAPPALPDIRLPEVTVPTPAPPPPGAVTRLTGEVMYVIQADVDAIVLASPEGLVGIVQESGPLRIRGRFIEDPTKVVTKTFSTKHIFIVEAFGVGKCELLVVPSKATKPSEVIRRTLDVDSGIGPRPPPVPPLPPDPKPPDPPVPPPGPVTDLRALVIYETADLSKLTPAQLNILYAKSVRDYLNAKTPLGPDGKTHEWRIYDKDVDLSADAPLWKELMSRPRASTPWVVLHGGGKVLYEGPVPANVDEALALLKKWGG